MNLNRQSLPSIVMRVLCAAAFLICPSAISAAVPTLISEFNGANGAYPQAGLIQASNGLFYGTASGGGGRGYGVVFSVSASGTLTPLYAFKGGTDGQGPAGLVQAGDGYLYGTTYGGGLPGPCGSVFRISLDGTFSVLYSFNYPPDGLNPDAGLVQGTDGLLYGTTEYGGTNDSGTIFKIDTDGNLTNLYSFTNGADGARPRAGLVQGRDGLFYGTASGGGVYGLGTVYRISSNGKFASLHSFYGPDGAKPEAALAQGSDGDFYGTTSTAPFNGTVFKIGPNGTLSTLHTFQPSELGADPSGPLVQGSDGYFYGMTAIGGVYLGAGQYLDQGTVFRISASGELTYLCTFPTNDTAGIDPAGGLVQGTNGSFYGVTINGGIETSSGGLGTIFTLAPPEPPWIVVQPASTNALNGTVAQFSVTAEGTPPLSYEWQLNGSNLASGGDVLGAVNTSTLSVTASAASAGAYTVIVTDLYGTVTSQAATLSVTGGPPPAPVDLLAVPLSGGGFWSLTFPTALGQTYIVQQNSNLGSSNWVFYTSLAGNGAPAQLAIPITTAPAQFFRVLEPY